MPEGAVILSTDVKNTVMRIWAMVDPRKPTTDRVIEVFPTGYDIPADMGVERKFIGSCIVKEWGISLVFHIFERMN